MQGFDYLLSNFLLNLHIRSDQFENLSIATIVEFDKSGNAVEKKIERQHVRVYLSLYDN